MKKRVTTEDLAILIQHQESSIEQLAIMMIRGFDQQSVKLDEFKHQTIQRFEKADESITNLKEDIGRRFHGVNQRFESIEHIISEFKKDTTVQFDKINMRFEKNESILTDFKEEAASNFKKVYYTINGITKSFLPRDEFKEFILKNLALAV